MECSTWPDRPHEQGCASAGRLDKLIFRCPFWPKVSVVLGGWALSWLLLGCFIWVPLTFRVVSFTAVLSCMCYIGLIAEYPKPYVEFRWWDLHKISPYCNKTPCECQTCSPCLEIRLYFTDSWVLSVRSGLHKIRKQSTSWVRVILVVLSNGKFMILICMIPLYIHEWTCSYAVAGRCVV